MLRALIVDDERLARREVADLLAAHSSVEIVGEAADVPSAARAAARLRPDVVFLDIQLGGGSGFDLLESLDEAVAVVFTTAYDEYAIRAFEVNAVDYLLKPIHPDRLAEAVARLGKGRGPAPLPGGRLAYTDLVLARSRGLLCSFRVRDILAIVAAGDYSRILTEGGGAFMLHSTMKLWEQRLPADSFCRIHRSVIVNLARVDRIAEGRPGSCRVHLRGLADPFPVSRRRARELRKRFR